MPSVRPSSHPVRLPLRHQGRFRRDESALGDAEEVERDVNSADRKASIWSRKSANAGCAARGFASSAVDGKRNSSLIAANCSRKNLASSATCCALQHSSHVLRSLFADGRRFPATYLTIGRGDRKAYGVSTPPPGGVLDLS